jgi:hypothetical protein
VLQSFGHIGALQSFVSGLLFGSFFFLTLFFFFFFFGFATPSMFPPA